MNLSYLAYIVKIITLAYPVGLYALWKKDTEINHNYLATLYFE